MAHLRFFFTICVNDVRRAKEMSRFYNNQNPSAGLFGLKAGYFQFKEFHSKNEKTQLIIVKGCVVYPTNVIRSIWILLSCDNYFINTPRKPYILK